MAEPLWRTFRVYFDVSVEDLHPGETEEAVLEQAVDTFYSLVDEGKEPSVVELL